MITLITDKRSLEECQALVRKILDTEPWQGSYIYSITGLVTGRRKERCWQFHIGIGCEDERIIVSRDRVDELPFVYRWRDSNHNSSLRRHIDPVTGQWVEDYTENVK